ncbi:hypothetical protein [Phreatobacter oligotrophus]|uniref:hypothetical protein n=1 Tax=Phreatobacter oligotrophus TaxID=1122261 RepID=UPI002352040E|nr:hypothetical protein [Phreatobacter oligotrophus]MBX9990927.1 hypothetical protein [Phreatobacter oligotrophus]
MTDHSTHPTLPRSVVREATVLLDSMVELLAADGIDRLAMADYFMAYGARLSAQFRGGGLTAERLRDFADVTEVPTLHMTAGAAGHA